MAKRNVKNDERELDDALDKTFPASDPISLDSALNDRARIDRQPAVLDRELVERLAREARSKAGPITRH